MGEKKKYIEMFGSFTEPSIRFMWFDVLGCHACTLLSTSSSV